MSILNRAGFLPSFGILLFASTSLSTTAFAQTEPVAEENEEATEGEIVVSASPIRDSLVKSTEIQRASDNLVNVIASDTIGRFPDATAAGALSRLPGVGVQRDQGQERYIQIRGAPTRWTQVALDGINVLGAEDRIFRFDSIPAVQIGQLILNKTLLADMPAEALAGRVNIIGYSPLDNKGFHFSGDFGRGFNDLGDGPVKNLAARASWANDQLGISAAYSKFSFEQQTDNSEPRFDEIGLTQLRITKYIIVRETESYSGRLQWQASDSLRLTASYLDTKFSDFETRDQLRYQFNRTAPGLPTQVRNFDSFSINALPTEATYQAPPVDGKGSYINGVKLAVLNAQFENDRWKAIADIAYARTQFDTETPLVVQTASTRLGNPTPATAPFLPSVIVNVNAKPGGIPTVTPFTTVLVGGVATRGSRLNSIDTTVLNTLTASEFSSNQRTQSWTSKLAVERDWESLGAESKLSFGFQVDNREQTTDTLNQILRDGITTGTALDLTSAAATLNLPFTPNAFITGRPWDTNFDFGNIGFYRDYPAIFAQFDAIQTAARAANAAGTGNFAVIASDPKLFNTVKERIIAGYVMNRWKWDRHTLVAGVRIENTRNIASGFLTIPASGPTPLRISPLLFQTEETSFFPSLHYTFDASDNFKLRAAFITGQARPSLDDLRPTVTINDVNRSVTGGNPALKPEKAYGFDLSAEWYFAPGAILSASAYHREVKDVLFDSSFTVQGSAYDSNGVSRSGYTFSSLANGDSGRLSGVELVYNHAWTFLPGPLSGFGFTGSITFNDGKFTTPDGREVAFPGTSDSIVSASIFYEKYGLSARLSYQTRSPWLDEVFPSGSGASSDLFWGRSTRVDASVRYQINENFSIYADGNNITNENGVRYQGVPDRPYEVESFGRRYLFGVRVNF